MLWALLALLLVGALVLSIGLLAVFVIRAVWAVRTASTAVRERLRHDLAALGTEELRTRLLTDVYFAAELRQVAAIREFLSRLQAGEEVLLAERYPRRKLYGMLARAESAARRPGRPEAVDAIDEIYEGLHELARRARRAP